MACAFCQEEHKKSLIEFDLDGEKVQHRAEYCRAIPAWIIKFTPMLDSRAGTLMVPVHKATLIKEQT